MNKDKLTPGDILLVRGDSFISKAIRFHMEAYRKALGIPKRELYSHSATVISVWGKLYVAEAQADGINIRTFEEAYGDKDLRNMLVKTPRKPYTKSEQEHISKVASNCTFKPTRYDFLSILYQVDMIRWAILTKNKKWSGPEGKKAEKRMYCTEASATWANTVRPNTFDKPWTINPLDIDLNKYYIDKDIS